MLVVAVVIFGGVGYWVKLTWSFKKIKTGFYAFVLGFSNSAVILKHKFEAFKFRIRKSVKHEDFSVDIFGYKNHKKMLRNE